MRDPGATLLAAQKTSPRTELVRLVLTNNGDTKTYYNHSGDNRIVSWDHIEEDDIQSAQIVLANADKTISALDLWSYKAVLSYGLTTSTSDEYSATAPMYVVGQQSHSWQGGLVVSLSLAGLSNLLNEDEASEAYTPASDDTDTVKTLFRKIAGDTGVTKLTCFTDCQSYEVEFVIEDDLIDTFIPADAFSIPYKANRLSKLKELLNLSLIHI